MKRDDTLKSEQTIHALCRKERDGQNPLESSWRESPSHDTPTDAHHSPHSWVRRNSGLCITGMRRRLRSKNILIPVYRSSVGDKDVSTATCHASSFRIRTCARDRVSRDEKS